MQPQKYSKIGQCKNYKIDKWLEIRVPFHFFERGGMVPPLRGGHKGGDSGPEGGEWRVTRLRQLTLIDIEKYSIELRLYYKYF